MLYCESIQECGSQQHLSMNIWCHCGMSYLTWYWVLVRLVRFDPGLEEDGVRYGTTLPGV